LYEQKTAFDHHSNMEIITSRKAMRVLTSDLKSKGRKIGFVPTMGALHEGHLSLVHKARAENDVVVVSIFVNPTQFCPNEDFAKYPRDLGADQALLTPFVDYLFYPSVAEMYGESHEEFVVGSSSGNATGNFLSFAVGDLGKCLCGLSRPQHFEGVALVLSKLLNIIQPDRVYMGQKDFQQTVVVKHLIEELFFETELVVCPTIREENGLAMSSRNVYLTAEEREKAAFIYRALQQGKKLVESGQKDPKKIIAGVKVFLSEHGFDKIDYVDLRKGSSLQEVLEVESEKNGKIVLALAVFLGKTRLIDNLLIF
jgi:pantoate--beta-alanine ligase